MALPDQPKSEEPPLSPDEETEVRELFNRYKESLEKRLSDDLPAFKERVRRGIRRRLEQWASGADESENERGR